MDETRSADRLPDSAAPDATPPKMTRNTGAISTGLTPGESQEYPEIPGYEILGVLGRGGMGVVYRARQLKANRIVALKMIRAVEHASPHERLRFQIETEAVARLQHPNIVQLHEVGEVRGQPYFSLEFCDGGTLIDQLKKKRPTPREAAELIETLARAMISGHEFWKNSQNNSWTTPGDESAHAFERRIPRPMKCTLTWICDAGLRAACHRRAGAAAPSEPDCWQLPLFVSGLQ